MSFEDEYDLEFVTTDALVEEYEASNEVFNALLNEVKELSKKKPDATMNAGKVKIVNRVLQNLLTVLEGQPQTKYLELLDDEALPQVSDAVLIMVQFKTALKAFKERHTQYILRQSRWVTEELVVFLKEDYDFEDPQDS